MACQDPNKNPKPIVDSYEVSWLGIRAVELSLTNNTSSSTKEVSIIIRLASAAEPLYTDVQNKIGFLSRSLTKGQAKRVYTAMHYSTKDSLKTSISSLAITDVLSPATAYRAYIFSAENIVIARIDFTTEAVPAAGDVKWLDSTMITEGPNLTLTHPTDKIISVQSGDTLLLPIYSKISYTRSSGLRFIRGITTNLVSCNLNIGSCLGSTPGYSAIDAEVFTNNNNYVFTILGVQSISELDFESYFINTLSGPVNSTSLRITLTE